MASRPIDRDHAHAWRESGVVSTPLELGETTDTLFRAVAAVADALYVVDPDGRTLFSTRPLSRSSATRTSTSCSASQAMQRSTTFVQMALPFPKRSARCFGRFSVERPFGLSAT